jgi:small subunit ribosomal protein S8
MAMTDPLADMLTRIRNAVKARFPKVDMPASNIKIDVARILKESGYIKDYKIQEDNKQNILTIELQYTDDGKPVLYGIDRISRPGRRVYVRARDVKPFLSGMGTAVLSTNCGVMTDRQARQKNLGGEILCKVW